MTFHNSKARTTTKELTDISHPRRLRVKGADTESPRGCRLDSGETGIQVSDGPSGMGNALQRTTGARLHDSSGLQVTNFETEDFLYVVIQARK